MSDRGGCCAGCRGYGTRKFNGVPYRVFKVYTAKQVRTFDHEAQEILNRENRENMEHDKKVLRGGGEKVRSVKISVEEYVLYMRYHHEKE